MKKVYLLLVACLGASPLFAQVTGGGDVIVEPWPLNTAIGPCPVAYAGEDFYDATDAVIIGPGPSGVIPGATYSWSPTKLLYTPNSANTAVKRDPDGGTHTYVLTMTPNTSIDLVTNGDFQQGNTGFSTQYTYIAPGIAGSQGQYTITPNPRVMNNQWCEYAGFDNVMAIDGFIAANVPFWSQTVTVRPNTTYTFSYDGNLLYSDRFEVGVSINGAEVSSEYLKTTCSWRHVGFAWNSGSNTTATLTLYSKSDAAIGNDFAIDNISFLEPCPTTTDTVTVSFRPRVPPCPIADAGPDLFDVTGSVVIGPSVVIPGATYSWQPASILFINDPNIPNPTVRSILGGGAMNYILTMTPPSGANLVTNGDFSQGNTGFSSQYTYIAQGTQGTQSQYTITPNPRAMNNQWCEYSGSDNVMAIDGSPAANVPFWSQTITVTPNTNYTLGFDANLLWADIFSLGASINGVPVATQQLTNTCTWVPVTANWNSGSTTTATITIYSTSNESIGNDFAIDNVRFTGGCPATTDTVTVTFKPRVKPPIGTFGEVSVYPNPAQQEVNIQLGGDAAAQIEIRDRNSTVVRTATGEGNVPVNVQDLPKGIYTISIRSSEGVTTKRLVIE